MHILILNWRDPKNPKSGGAEIVTQEFAKGWVNKGNDVTWFTSRFTGSKPLESIDGIKIVRTGNYFAVFFYAFLYFMRHKNEIDIVIDQIHGIPFFTPLYVRKPIIAFIHEVANEIWDYMYPFPINKIGKFLEPLYLSFYKKTQFWTDANSTCEELVGYGIPKKNCTAINLPANNPPLTKLPEKEKNPTFIFTSRVVPMKGIEEVIRAFFFIVKKDSTSQLWIVGTGDASYIEKIKQSIAEHKLESHVTFFGRLTNDKKLELMSKAHILLHASVKEGWGLVVIEAASQGTPSVVYNVAGLRDSVKHNETGIVLYENSPQLMAEVSFDLLYNKQKYHLFQKNCLQWAASLTWEKAHKESLDLIEKIIESKL